MVRNGLARNTKLNKTKLTHFN